MTLRDYTELVADGRGSFTYYKRSPDDLMCIYRAMRGQWLHGLPRDSVYLVVIDSFRLREQDSITKDETEPGNTPDKFQKYLDLLESRNGMAPAWWDRASRSTCVARAMQKKSQPNIHSTLSQKDILDFYRDPVMPTKLRALAAKVYGWEFEAWGVFE